MGEVLKFVSLNELDNFKKSIIKVYDKEENDWNLTEKAYYYAYEFSYATEIFDGDKNFIENYECDPVQIHLLRQSLSKEYNDSGISDILAEIKKKYNLTIPEEAFCKKADSTMDRYDLTGNQTSWTYQNV